jgi:predicted lipid-binding transport protein (Tim44 family)
MDNQNQNPNQNPNSDDTSRKIIGGAAGLGIGGWLGSSIGIAAFGTAISGLLPVALIGGYVGWKLMSKNKKESQDSKDK